MAYAARSLRRVSTLLLLAIVALPAFTDTAAGSAEDDAWQPVPESAFRTLSWRNIGPDRGGRSIGAAGSPGRRHEYYFGAVGGGLWKTTDGGNNWAPVTDGLNRGLAAAGRSTVAVPEPS